MTKKRALLMAGLLTLQLVAASAASKDLVSYSADRLWQTETVTEGSQFGETTVEASTVSIQTNVKQDEIPKEGERVTFTATLNLGDTETEQVIRWYVNGDCMQATSLTGKTIKSTFSMNYEGPATVYCEFNGQYKHIASTKISIGTIEQKTPILSIGRTDTNVKEGAQWAWDMGVDGQNAEFSIPVSGVYKLHLTAADGTSRVTSVRLAAGKVCQIYMTEALVDFDGQNLAARTEAYTADSTIVLELVETGIAFINPMGDVTAAELGQTVTMSAKANANGAQVTYQWFLSPDGSTEHGFRIPDATDATYSFEASLEQNGMGFFCKATSGTAELDTTVSELKVCIAPPAAPQLLINDMPSEAVRTDVWLEQTPIYRATLPEGTEETEGAGELLLRISADGGATWRDIENGIDYALDAAVEGTVQLIAEVYNSAMPSLFKRTEAFALVDTKAPTVVVEGLDQTWTLSNQTLRITQIEEDGLGIDDAPFSWDGGKTWGMNMEYTVAQNQTVQLRIRDVAGNIRINDIVVSNIDRARPGVSVTTNTTDWTHSVTLTAAGVDDASGIAENGYSWDGGNTWTNESSITIQKNATVLAQVRDNAGFLSDIATVKVSNIDSDKPTIAVNGNPDKWQNAPAAITIQANDATSGLHEMPYSWDGGKTWTASGTMECTKNGQLSVSVRDAAGNTESATIVVSKIDTTAPSGFSIIGNPTSWTGKDVILQATNAQDADSGLAAEAYNWNGTGWTASPGFAVKDNQTVTLEVRDALGNVSSQSISVTMIDKNKPTITAISGIPTTWQTGPATITVTAADVGAGLAEKAYSFDDGVTWQAEGTVTISENKAVGLKVRDKAGNVTYQPFIVSYISQTHTASSLPDNNGIVMTSMPDAEPQMFMMRRPAQEEEIEETISQTEEVSAIMEMAETLPDNAAPEVEISTRRLILDAALPIDGWSFGPVNRNGTGTYITASGARHQYDAYAMGGTVMYGLAVSVHAEPAYGGYIGGYATLNGETYPIYWNTSCTQLLSEIGGEGTFYIDAKDFCSSVKNGALRVTMCEYETQESTRPIVTDSISAAITIDTAAPAVTLERNETAQELNVVARDALAGIDYIGYRITNSAGTGEWKPYTAPISIPPAGGTIELMAIDKLGNTRISDPQNISANQVTSGYDDVAEGGRYEDSVFYRTDLFNYFLIGTEKEES